jgi:hypothetical protein
MLFIRSIFCYVIVMLSILPRSQITNIKVFFSIVFSNQQHLQACDCIFLFNFVKVNICINIMDDSEDKMSNFLNNETKFNL